MKKRSNLQIMSRLVVLVKPLTGYMFLAVTLGLLGHLCAAFITIFGGYAVLNLLDFAVPMSMTAIFICTAVFAVVRGLLRYGEQA